MPEAKPLILGEFSRKLDDRFRLSLPQELLEQFKSENGDCMIAKERPGCVSLWSAAEWSERMKNDVEIVEKKFQNGYLNQKIPQLQALGRLLSTRQRPIQLTEKGRILLPEGFREFLRVEAKGEVMVVGAAVCVEIWNPELWVQYTEASMERFQETFAELAG